jgi:lipoprotein-anchoring transpeptidase ErfK/SrfK
MTGGHDTGAGPGHGTEHPRRDRRRRRSRRRTLFFGGIGAGVALLVVALTLVVTGLPQGSVFVADEDGASQQRDNVRAAAYNRLTPQQVAALPEARHDAVIPGLLAYATTDVPRVSHEVYTVSEDTPIYDDERTPVARFAFTNFADRPTIIVPVRADGEWTLVMTPARKLLPSQADGAAPAQTAGWVRTDALRRIGGVDRRVVISVSAQTLSIQTFSGEVTASYQIGVGAPGTPTPSGVTGYIQERYLDPDQGQDTHPIQLTSLHSSARDEPYQGEDGGLIGMHYFSAHAGAVSHGCLRLPQDAITAVNELPLGTSVTILP